MIEFRSSRRATLGVELELGIVDRASRQLVSIASELLTDLGGPHPEGVHPKAKHELFESTVEIITGVCETVAEARHDLALTLDELRAVLEPRGLAAFCSGTHPTADWTDQVMTDDPRYAALMEEMQWVARRFQIFGVHFHVGVRTPEKAIVTANALAAYLAHFLALSASSPYWRGHDTGLASARVKIFEGLPTAGVPTVLHDWDEFARLMQTLINSGAIRSIREIWWDVRPHPDFGTVELRVCDGLPSLPDVAALGALVQSFVEWVDRRIDGGEPVPCQHDWVVRQNKWRATRYGIDAQILADDSGAVVPLRDSVQELVEELLPVASDLGCALELATVSDLLDRGPGYVRQRRIVAAGGTLDDVVDHLVKELEIP